MGRSLRMKMQQHMEKSAQAQAQVVELQGLLAQSRDHPKLNDKLQTEPLSQQEPSCEASRVSIQVVQVPQIEYVERINEVPQIEYVERNVPQIEYVEKMVEVPQVEYIKKAEEVTRTSFEASGIGEYGDTQS